MNNTYSYSRRHTISGPATFACTLMACVACWIVSYLNSVGYPVYGEVTAPPLWNAICQVLPGKAFTYAIGMLLMFGGAFLLHRANYVLVLIREKTLLPFLFYVLFISTNPDFLPLKSTSVGVFCLILAIYQLFTSYHDPGAKSKAYNASLLIGIGSLGLDEERPHVRAQGRLLLAYPDADGMLGIGVVRHQMDEDVPAVVRFGNKADDELKQRQQPAGRFVGILVARFVPEGTERRLPLIHAGHDQLFLGGKAAVQRHLLDARGLSYGIDAHGLDAVPTKQLFRNAEDTFARHGEGGALTAFGVGRFGCSAIRFHNFSCTAVAGVVRCAGAFKQRFGPREGVLRAGSGYNTLLMFQPCAVAAFSAAEPPRTQTVPARAASAMTSANSVK